MSEQRAIVDTLTHLSARVAAIAAWVDLGRDAAYVTEKLTGVHEDLDDVERRLAQLPGPG